MYLRFTPRNIFTRSEPGALVIGRSLPNTAAYGGDLVSTWVANPFVHAEVQVTSLNHLQTL